VYKFAKIWKKIINSTTTDRIDGTIKMITIGKNLEYLKLGIHLVRCLVPHRTNSEISKIMRSEVIHCFSQL